jgi:hypothetical protein
MSEDGETSIMLVCHLGLERSRAGSEAFNSIGIKIGHFVGGTREMARLTTNELKDQVGTNTDLLLIYDQGSPTDEYRDKEIATDKLRKAGIEYSIIDTPQLEIMLRERGLELSDYLY